jgi:hypothetical protein
MQHNYSSSVRSPGVITTRCNMDHLRHDLVIGAVLSYKGAA